MADTGWKVTNQVANQVRTDNAGNTNTGVEVYFITGEGNEGSVFIIDTHYNPKVVKAAVEARAKLMDEIGGLAAQGQQGG